MHVFHRVSQYWFDWIVNASWQLGLFICIVAAVNFLARKTTARFRHGLWLLVLLKVFLPTELATPFSVGAWGFGPLIKSAESAKMIPTSLLYSNEAIVNRPDTMRETRTENEIEVPASRIEFNLGFPVATNLFLVWIAGLVSFWFVVSGNFIRLSRVLHLAHKIEEGPMCVSIEKLAITLRLRRVPEIVVCDFVSFPFLIGVIRPLIVMPKSMMTELADVQRQVILAHELVHWYRCDTWIGWAQVIAQSLFWFHPFVWWANAQLRHERECACDEVVLRLGNISPQDYGESIIRVLTVSRGRSLATASLVGVFERGTNLQFRLEEILNYKRTNVQGLWRTVAAWTVFGILFLPMAQSLKSAPAVLAGEADSARVSSLQSAYPTIVETIPRIGATGIDPALTEIRVTFDRDMQEGMSWTGGPPLFPPLDENREAKWIDRRTCVLPVTLEEGSYYRTGINSTSYQNFRSTKGVPALPSAIYFTTKGTVDGRVRVPVILTFEPANGAKDVAPSTPELKLTFDTPMGDGMSWCGADDLLDAEDDRAASWSPDGRTCSLPVKLEPGRDYEIHLNDRLQINFQSRWGVPLVPVIYKFRTRLANE